MPSSHCVRNWICTVSASILGKIKSLLLFLFVVAIVSCLLRVTHLLCFETQCVYELLEMRLFRTLFLDDKLVSSNDLFCVIYVTMMVFEMVLWLVLTALLVKNRKMTLFVSQLAAVLSLFNFVLSVFPSIVSETSYLASAAIRLDIGLFPAFLLLGYCQRFLIYWMRMCPCFYNKLPYSAMIQLNPLASYHHSSSLLQLAQYDNEKSLRSLKLSRCYPTETSSSQGYDLGNLTTKAWKQH